ncbi:MAG: FAD-dependent oxidoreductase [Methylicorpusculum sp.]|uniref:NAD(P)/FAD-dependent oxidoreductase n=1 Tax=Methylicorpusculum sp. TaxID=2713644 RepID=UPI00271F53C5|nr:FAD-dependent oxidoreductase [Methylicorpusculum sp.]MDO8941462.1 FAD-dependent oxidoreductase [Methylicorpusculum sp.]MDO9238634.1 FAD-dependent oxidoreductase [Methylicorpusculum sp.]MDP2204343.1 FAD-dependent oxidoreductase [Methylicorpusculum sp.]
MKLKLVVIGNGMAGMRTVESLIESAPDLYDITVFGAEPYGNYNRILLTPVLYGEKRVDDIMIHDFAWYHKHGITLYCGPGKTVVDVDREKQIVIARDGTQAYYDKLLIATGSVPLILPIPGRDADGVMSFREIADVEAMIEKSETRQHAVVLGGGLLGIEAANGLQQRGMNVTVVNRAGHLLNRQLDDQAGAMLKKQLESKGLSFKLGCTINNIIAFEGHISQVELSDGSVLQADLLIMATGILPNMMLARHIGLDCDKGIVVDDSLRTSDPAIYSVGECVQHRGELFGLVAPVYEQAKVCAQHLAHKKAPVYQSLQPATRLKVTGIDLFSAGDFTGEAGAEQIVFIDPALNIYKKLIIKNSLIAGVLLYGDTADSAWYLDLLKNKIDISPLRDGLIFGQTPLSAAA